MVDTPGLDRPVAEFPKELDEAARTDAERLLGTQGTKANILSFDTQPGDIVAFHWAIFHGGGATPPHVKRRTVALRYVGPRCFMSPRSTHSPEERDRSLRKKRPLQ